MGQKINSVYTSVTSRSAHRRPLQISRQALTSMLVIGTYATAGRLLVKFQTNAEMYYSTLTLAETFH